MKNESINITIVGDCFERQCTGNKIWVEINRNNILVLLQLVNFEIAQTSMSIVFVI